MCYKVTTIEYGQTFRDYFDTRKERDAFLERIKDDYSYISFADVNEILDTTKLDYKEWVFFKPVPEHPERWEDIRCMVIFDDRDDYQNEYEYEIKKSEVRIRKPATLEVKIPFLWREKYGRKETKPM